MIKDKAKQIICEQLRFESGKIIDWNQSLQELGADSLDMVELTMKFEDAFKVEINDQTMMQLCTQAKLDQIISCLK